MEKGFSMCIDLIDTLLFKIESDAAIEDIKEYLELKKIEAVAEKSRLTDITMF